MQTDYFRCVFLVCPTYVELDPGKPRKSATDDAIPPAAVLALRTTMGLVDIPRDPVKTFKFGQKEFKLADLFAVIDAEDGVTAAAGGGGSSAGGAAGSDGGGAAGSSAGGAAGSEGGAAVPAGTAERKGPNCMIRLVSILVEDDVRPLLIN